LGRIWIIRFGSVSIDLMQTCAVALVQRRHVDLLRVNSALCALS
jgi:hypothetical protein